MNEKILLFGFDSLTEVLAIAGVAKTFGAELISVARSDYHKSLAVLLGEEIEPRKMQQAYIGGAPGGRMLVLYGLDRKLDKLLSALQNVGVGSDCLKAAVTAQNRHWNPVTLYSELLREHNAMRRK